MIDGGAAALLAAALALALSLWPPFREIESRIFDVLSTSWPPAVASGGPNDTVIVAIDEPSFSEIGMRWPWPRSLHADLVRSLRAAGAKAIGLDLIFAEPSEADEDFALAASLGPDVVLAADRSLIETPQMSQLVRTEPLAALLTGGARVGFATLPLDADGTLRRLPAESDAFARALLRIIDQSAADRPARAETLLVQALGPARTIPTVSYYQALDPAAFLPPDMFKDKLVLVGRSLQSAVSAESGGPDSFATPFTLRSGALVPGVEVHATIIETLRRDLVIAAASPALAAATIAFAALLGFACAWRPTDRWTGVLALVLFIGLFAVSFALLKTTRFYLPPLAPALAGGLATVAIGARDLAEERRRRREIVKAFSLYLAPEQVKRLVAEPQALKLGGETRRLTILFSDVRNFTPLAEGLKDEPEKLTLLMNRLLTPLSEAVFAQGGTIDKFIGDCIMAFWNAPIEDEQHAVHAVRAGLAMLAAVERLNEELRAEVANPAEVPRLTIGVGINTGLCVVGNFGSEKRFDYSVLGDAVNYASRLEGASKLCGVPLLLGAETARETETELGPVLVDRIAVKGRSEPELVYTVLPGPPVHPCERAALDRLVRALLDGATTVEVSFTDPRLRPFYERIQAREMARQAPQASKKEG
ncbi:CHASE2 domain-containing protein [Aureimonas endophytica]|nr:adenylate/guanylate cyclase domain-containing protein [Aureimonas endophytica]